MQKHLFFFSRSSHVDCQERRTLAELHNMRKMYIRLCEMVNLFGLVNENLMSVDQHMVLVDKHYCDLGQHPVAGSGLV